MDSLVRLSLMTLALVAAWVPRAWAQASDYPNRTVTLVVPLAPGGGNDVLARLVGQKLERKFGKSFVIENRPAGGGIPAALGVVRGPADGYTLIAASSTLLALNTTAQEHAIRPAQRYHAAGHDRAHTLRAGSQSGATGPLCR